MISKKQAEKSRETFKNVCDFVGSKIKDGHFDYNKMFRELVLDRGVKRQTFYDWIKHKSDLNVKNLNIVEEVLTFERERFRKFKVVVITATETF